MTTYRQVQRLKPEAAAYLAGLVDGEGTITLPPDFLEFVREMDGAGRITGKRTYSERHRPSFAYRVWDQQALDLLSEIARYLKTYRSKRAAMALEKYVQRTPRSGKYTAEMLRMREDFEREFLAVGPGPRTPRQSA